VKGRKNITRNREWMKGMKDRKIKAERKKDRQTEMRNVWKKNMQRTKKLMN
jgi:hypothetical protein